MPIVRQQECSYVNKWEGICKKKEEKKDEGTKANFI